MVRRTTTPTKPAAARPADTKRPRVRKPPASPPLEASLAAERVAAKAAAEQAAIGHIAAASGIEGVEAIIAGASPDDAARLRLYVGLPKPTGCV